MNLPESVRTEIADCTVRFIAPAIVLSMMFAGLAMFFTGDRQYYRLIPGLVAAVSMVPAWLLARKGRPRQGALVILLAMCLAVFCGMVFSGGVRAPAYIATIPCITMFILLYGARGGVLFGLLMISGGGLFVWLDRMGMIREAEPPSDMFYLMFIATYLILQFSFVLIPVRMMNKALTQSLDRSEALKQAVYDRQQSRKELQSILNKTPDIIYRLDPDGKFTFISEAVRKYGRSPDFFLGKPIKEFVHPADHEAALPRLHERRSGKRGSIDLEVRLRIDFRSGHKPVQSGEQEGWRTFMVSSEGLYSGAPGTGPGFRGSQGIARDVSRTKRYESRIKTLAAVIEQAAEDVVITDPEGVIRYVNPSFETLTGYDKDEVIGKKTCIFKSGKQGRAFYEDLWATVKQGDTWNGKIWNRIKDGSLILQDVTITPILDASGGITGFASIRRDITQQEKLEERLKQSRKMEAIGTLAGGIAHDFNNILGAILGYSELAQGDLKPDDPVVLYVKQIAKAGERAKELVRQILLFSRQAEQEKQPVRVTLLAKEVIRLLRATLPADIEINTVFREEDGLVLSDPAQIHQILMNLCTNAVHAMKDRGGTITVIMEKYEVGRAVAQELAGLAPGGYLKIVIRDTGHGIPAEIRDKIFDPFFTTKSREEGTGMGLSVVYGIVEDHGGAIQVESEPGRGSAFLVFLPAAPSREEAAGLTEPAVPKGHGHILFVDDEPELAGLGKLLLERLGYEVTAISDSRAAWYVFQDNPDRYALVVTDNRMPGISGMALAGKILALRPDTPVIMCTGFNEADTVARAEAIGIRKLMNKPIISKDIGEAIRGILDG